MKITTPKVMMDFHRHIYLVVKEATKLTYFVRFDAAHMKVEKMINKEVAKTLTPIKYDSKQLAQRWLDKESTGMSITAGAKDVLTQVLSITTNQLC